MLLVSSCLSRRETEEGLKRHHSLFRWVYSFCVASLSGRVPMLRTITPQQLLFVRRYSYLTPLG